MPRQVTARLPELMGEALDAAAQQLRRRRADIIRQPVEHYLEDFDDLSIAIQRLRHPGDPVLDWGQVRRARYGVSFSIRFKVPIVRIAHRRDVYRRAPA